MNVDEIKEKLNSERNIASRFPVRMIFVESFLAYSDLENKLRAICDVTFNVVDFCKGDDTVPRFDKMTKEFSLNYKDKQILLLSVGEYLRLCLKRELDSERGQFKAFWTQMQSVDSKTRYIIPVFNCRDIFNRIVGVVDDRQQDFIWTLDGQPNNEQYDVLVYSPAFRKCINAQAISLKAWLQNWQKLLHKNSQCIIITQFCNYVEPTHDVVNIQCIDKPFYYLKTVLRDGSLLNEKWGNENFWTKIVAYITEKKINEPQFSKIILDILNLKNFNFKQVAALWGNFDDLQRTLVWIWYQLFPTEDYFSYACIKAASPSEIPIKIRDEIFSTTKKCKNWIEERNDALKAFAFTNFDEAYFALLDKVPSAEIKLQLLTYQTHEEKKYAIKVVSKLLRDGVDLNDVAAMVQRDYPILSVYLKESIGKDLIVDEYMSWYKKNKIINCFPSEYPKEIDVFDRFDSRLKLLQKMHDKDCFKFWIDGFGIEWVPIFLYELKAKNIKPENVDIATALLPTETEYNHQWDANDLCSSKWDRLDKLSHKGRPDDRSYYSCIVNQFSVFAEAAKEVKKLLKYHDYVAITGDHGSSRLAALAFHEPSVVPIIAPPNAKVCSFGRFCELEENGEGSFVPDTTKVERDGKTFIIMNNYQHFVSSGNAAGGNSKFHDVAGEIHGGNTPEERLVPVIIIKRATSLPVISCSVKSVSKENGNIKAVLKFSEPVSSLNVSYNTNKAICTLNDDKTWQVVIISAGEESMDVTVIANNRLLPSKVNLTIKRRGIRKNKSFSEFWG